jgi:hypothetical protein
MLLCSNYHYSEWKNKTRQRYKVVVVWMPKQKDQNIHMFLARVALMYVWQCGLAALLHLLANHWYCIFYISGQPRESPQMQIAPKMINSCQQFGQIINIKLQNDILEISFRRWDRAQNRCSKSWLWRKNEIFDNSTYLTEKKLRSCWISACLYLHKR